MLHGRVLEAVALLCVCTMKFNTIVTKYVGGSEVQLSKRNIAGGGREKCFLGAINCRHCAFHLGSRVADPGVRGMGTPRKATLRPAQAQREMRNV